MKIYLVRHGDAVSSNLSPLRPLSAIGQQQVLALAEHLRQKQAAIATIFHSGILRAQQTAELLARTLDVAAVEKLPGLEPEDAVEILLAFLDTWSEPVLLVGHLPYLPQLIATLTGDLIQLETAGCACLHKKAAIPAEDLRELLSDNNAAQKPSFCLQSGGRIPILPPDNPSSGCSEGTADKKVNTQWQLAWIYP